MFSYKAEVSIHSDEELVHLEF